MIITNVKAILFTSLLALSLGINTAQAQELTTEQEAQIDEIVMQIVQMQQENLKYEKLPETPERADHRARNLEKIDRLFAQLDAIVPPRPTVEIDSGLKEQMVDAQFALMESGLPLLEIYIGSSTGLLTIIVNQEESTDLESRIQDLIGEDIPIEVRYSLDTARFHGSCNTATDYCDPLIGGSLGEDQANGLNCTISIAVVRNNWPWNDENGIIIPDHCNPSTSVYYQADKDTTNHRVGTETKDGGWYCDCDFIKSDLRTINTIKINNNGIDISLTGNADIKNEKWVTLYGFVSGYDAGQIKEVDVIKQFDGNWFSDLYKIQYVSYTNGDSEHQ